jgi:hypothetical protein
MSWAVGREKSLVPAVKRNRPGDEPGQSHKHLGVNHIMPANARCCKAVRDTSWPPGLGRRPATGADDFISLFDLADDLGHGAVSCLGLAAGADVIHVDLLHDLLGLLAGGRL